MAHLDIKPSNIMMDKCDPVIIDFGMIQPAGLTRQKSGTVVFMAPEILNDYKYDTQKADIYSLGVLLFTMIYRNNPQ